MGLYNKTNDRSGNNSVFFGLVATVIGAGLLVAGGRKQKKAEIKEDMENGLRGWGDLKRENEALYMRCLRELES